MLKKFQTLLQNFTQLKNSQQALKLIIVLNFAMAVISNIVDFDWLMGVPRHLILFTPICSLYPLLLCIWFSLYYFKKRIPSWFTAFICMGIISYGFMAWIYYPLSMSWSGFSLRSVGNMIWVTIYASQALLLIPEIKKMPIYQYSIIFSYFFFKDYSDRFLGTFIDITIDDYPENLKLIFTISIVILHIFASVLIITIPHLKKINAESRNTMKRNELQTESKI